MKLLQPHIVEYPLSYRRDGEKERELKMKKIKEVQELLMEAMTSYVIAVKAGVHFTAVYYMGRIHSYLDVLGGYVILNSPWYAFWRKVVSQSF